MKGDFSRLTFDPAKRYTSVRRQQGRLQLDADWNEQADIFLHHLEALAGDLVGASGAPAPELMTFRVRASGTVSSSGLNLIGNAPPPGDSPEPGVDAIFQDDLRPGSTVLAAGQSRLVMEVLDDQHALLDRPFDPELPPGTILQVAGSGRVRSTGKALVGSDTEFFAQVQEGDEIEVGGQVRKVASVPSQSFLLVTEAFSPDLPLPSNFQVSVSGGREPRVAAGRYYVGGMLCELETEVPLTAQPDLPGFALPEEDGRYLAYLTASDLHETTVEQPDLAEPALGGPDTASRTRVAAAVRLSKVADTAACGAFAGLSLPGSAPPFQLAASATSPPLADRTYRVEIHTGGALGKATFKWARDNAMALAPVEALGPGEVTVASPVGLDGENAFAAGQWVEVTDPQRLLAGEPGVLVRLSRVVGQSLTVEEWPGGIAPVLGDGAVLRRWDSEGDAVVTASGTLPLEDGIEVRFAAGATASALPGDAWLIPARRAAAGGVLWPQSAGAPAFVPPQAGRPRHAPLALLDRKAGAWTVKSDCREQFGHLSERASLDTKVNVPGDTMTGPLFIDSDLAFTGTLNAGGTAAVTGARVAVQGGDLRLAAGNDARSGILFPVTGASQGTVRFFQPTGSGPRLVLGAPGPGDVLALSQAGVDRLVVAGGRVGIAGLPDTVIDGLQLDVHGTARTQDLRIEGRVTIAGGAPDTGDLLTSDAAGLATWKGIAVAARGRPSFFPSRIGIGSGTGPQGETLYTFAAGGPLPDGATAVILEAQAATTDGDGRILIFTGTGGSRRLLLRARALGGEDVGGWSSQGVFPLAGRSFRYAVVHDAGGTTFTQGWSLTAVGYYQ